MTPARYAETGSVSEEDTSTWRRSSVPLLHHQVFKPAVIEIYAMHKWLILVWTLSSHHDCLVGLWFWTIWARLGLFAARAKTEVIESFYLFHNSLYTALCRHLFQIRRSVGETATWFAKRWKCWRRGGTSLGVDCKSKRFGVDRCGGNIEQMTLKTEKRRYRLQTQAT